MAGRRGKPGRKPSGSTGPKRAPADPAAALAEANRLLRKAADVDSIEEVAVLALSALGLSPDCAAAYVLLGNCAASAEEVVDLFRRGVAAADRVLGAERFRVATVR